MSKKLVKTTLFYGKKASRDYIGRLLGIIDDIELQCILREKGMKRKLLRAEGREVRELADLHDDIVGFRICMVVENVDEKPVGDRFLFISEKIEAISYTQFNDEVKELAVLFGKGPLGQDNWLVVSGDANG